MPLSIYNANTIVFKQVEDGYRTGYNKTLASFNAIDTSNDIDGISAEYGQHSHVHIVQYSYIVTQKYT